MASLTLIVKQNYARSFSINWQGNIIWPQKKAAQITQTPNMFDIFRFYKLPETSHIIAEIVGQNYSF